MLTYIRKLTDIWESHKYNTPTVLLLRLIPLRNDAVLDLSTAEADWGVKLEVWELCDLKVQFQMIITGTSLLDETCKLRQYICCETLLLM